MSFPAPWIPSPLGGAKLAKSTLHRFRWLPALALCLAMAGWSAFGNEPQPVVRADYGIQKPGDNPQHDGSRPLPLDLSWPHAVLESMAAHPVVHIDVAQDSGEVTTNGVAAGAYRFYRVARNDGPSGWILKVQFLAPSVNWHAYFYAVDDRRTSFAFFGATIFNAAQELDTSGAFYPTLLKLLFDPETFTSDSLIFLDDASHRTTPVLDSLDFYAGYLPFLYRAELAANLRNPRLNLTYTGCVPSCAWLSHPGAVSPVQRYGMAQTLADSWDQLPLEARVPYLAPFTDGGSRPTLELLGSLVIDWLFRTRDANIETQPWRMDQLYRVLNGMVPRLIETPGINPVLRAELIDRVAEALPTYIAMSSDQNAVVNILAKTLGTQPGSASPAQQPRLLGLLRQLLLRPAVYPATLSQIGRALTPFLDAEMIQQLNVHVSHWLNSSTTDPLPELIGTFRLPLTDENRTRLAARLAELPGWSSGNELPYFTQVVPPTDFLAMPEALLDAFLAHAAQSLVERFPERGEVDSFHGGFDGTMSRVLRIARRADRFENHAPLFVPLLRRACPRQPDETEAAYAERFSRIENLWSSDRMFLFDLKGGSRENPDFFPAFTDFATTHPDWVHLLGLQRDEPGRAEVNVGAQFDWATYSTPFLIANSLLHEGAHALDLLGDPEDTRIDEWSRYWYHHRSADIRRLVSEYSATNPLEFWAEHARYWFQDTRLYFQRALDRYREGEPGMLHLFLHIWNLPAPRDLPGTEVRPVFQLQPNGLLLRDTVPARWTSGDSNLGEFTATLDGHTYAFEYQRGLIQRIRQDDQPFAQQRQPPTFLLPVFVIQPAGTPLVFTNLLEDADPNIQIAVVEGPPGVSVNVQDRTLSWTPSLETTNAFQILRLRATASVASNLVSEHRMVVAIDRPIRVAPVPILKGPELKSLFAQLEVIDPGSSRPPLTFRAESSRAGLNVDASNGFIQWVPTEDDGPGEHVFTIRISDTSSPPKTTSVEVRAIVEEANEPPRLSATAQGRGVPGQRVEIPLQFSDPDRPANRLTWSLDNPVPEGAFISDDGVFMWTIPATAQPERRSIQVTLQDDGTPSLRATTTVVVTVLPASLPSLAIRPAEAGILELSFTGDDAVVYSVESSSDLVSWQSLTTQTLSGGMGILRLNAEPTIPVRFFRMRRL